jgi:ABC-type phosphate transport system substrate-binding protein
MRAITKVLLVALVAVAPAAALGSGYVVVANPSVRASTLTRGELSRIFLRLSSEWPTGEHARPVDQGKAAPIREAFSRDALGKSVAAVDQFWVQAIFSGRAVPPIEKRNDAEVIAYVRDTPGAIGYVAASAPTEGLKQIAVKD